MLSFKAQIKEIKRFLEYSKDLKFDAGNEINDMSTEHSSTNLWFSIGTLMEQTKPLIKEKDDSEDWDKSNLRSTFGNFGISGYFSIEKNHRFLTKYFLITINFQIVKLIEEVKPIVMKKLVFEKWKEIKIKCAFCKLEITMIQM